MRQIGGFSDIYWTRSISIGIPLVGCHCPLKLRTIIITSTEYGVVIARRTLTGSILVLLAFVICASHRERENAKTKGRVTPLESLQVVI